MPDQLGIDDVPVGEAPYNPVALTGTTPVQARAKEVVDEIAELAAGQAGSAGQAARAAEQAPRDGDPITPPAYHKATTPPATVVGRVRRQSAVVDRLASFGKKRRDLIDALVDLDAQIVSTCQDGALAGLTWPEIHEALGSDVGGGQPREWTVGTVERLYARATSKVEGPQPPLGWAAPRRRKR